eukprot:COSAG03_NODE_457_length_7754_cov_8.253690_3_plen_113_part_00
MFEITQPLRWQVVSISRHSAGTRCWQVRSWGHARLLLRGLGAAEPSQVSTAAAAWARPTRVESPPPHAPPLRQAEQRATPGLRRALAGGRSPERGLGMAELPEDGAVLMEVG